MHRLKLHYCDGILTASCECGSWRREWTLRDEEDPLRVVDGVDAEYDRHVDESTDGEG
ncbi:MAG: hypothetical protein U0793_26385 [Gemmataceae bacterium]